MQCPVCNSPSLKRSRFVFMGKGTCPNCGARVRTRKGLLNAVVALPFLLLIPITKLGLSPDALSGLAWALLCGALSLGLAVMVTRLEPA